MLVKWRRDNKEKAFFFNFVLLLPIMYINNLILEDTYKYVVPFRHIPSRKIIPTYTSMDIGHVTHPLLPNAFVSQHKLASKTTWP